MNKTTIAFAKLVSICILTIIFICVLFSCNPQRKINNAYNRVAANIPATLKNKSQLGGWVAFHFPIEEKTIIKDTVVYDFIESWRYDTVTIAKDSIIYKYISKTDTLIIEKNKFKTTTVKDTVGNFAKQLYYNDLIDSNNALKANAAILNAKLLNSIADEIKATRKAHNWFWLFIILLGASIGSHYLRTKLF